jgi:hypothetical protein
MSLTGQLRRSDDVPRASAQPQLPDPLADGRPFRLGPAPDSRAAKKIETSAPVRTMGRALRHEPPIGGRARGIALVKTFTRLAIPRVPSCPDNKEVYC